VSWQDNDQRIAKVHDYSKEQVKLVITQCAYAITHRLPLIWRLKPGAVCRLQLVDAHGNVMPPGSWQYRKGSSWYPASSALTEADLRTFELTIGGKVVASVNAD
jgi:hypothetical protein